MDFFEAVEKRRSCRKYSSEPISEQDMNKIIDAGLLAPNSSNMQAWKFIWPKNAKIKAQIAEACFSQPSAKTAAELIVCVADGTTWNRNRKLILEFLGQNPKIPKQAFDYYDKLMPLTYSRIVKYTLGVPFKALFGFVSLFRPAPQTPHLPSELNEVLSKSTALACENMMLAATALGYASCPMEGFDSRRVKKILGLSCFQSVVMIISFGHPLPEGIWGEQFRIPREMVVQKIE